MNRPTFASVLSALLDAHPEGLLWAEIDAATMTDFSSEGRAKGLRVARERGELLFKRNRTGQGRYFARRYAEQASRFAASATVKSPVRLKLEPAAVQPPQPAHVAAPAGFGITKLTPSRQEWRDVPGLGRVLVTVGPQPEAPKPPPPIWSCLRAGRYPQEA